MRMIMETNNDFNRRLGQNSKQPRDYKTIQQLGLSTNIEINVNPFFLFYCCGVLQQLQGSATSRFNWCLTGGTQIQQLNDHLESIYCVDLSNDTRSFKRFNKNNNTR